MEPEPIDKFEQELRQAFLRRPAPPSLKRRILDQRNRRRTQKIHDRVAFWQKIAASFVVAAVLGGGFTWRHIDQQRKGEAARQQVLTALRITNHALNEMNARLAARKTNNDEQ